MMLRLLAGVAAVTMLAAAAYAYTAVDYNRLGIEAYNGKSYNEAIRHFELALESAPENDTLRRNLCNARQGAADELAKGADFAAAVQHLERAIRVDPGNPSPLVQLGAYYLRLDMVGEAIYRLEEAIELKPGFLDAHELLGEAYYRDNDLPWARRQWEYVLEMDPSRAGLRERYEKAFREESVETGFEKSGSSHFRLSGPKDLPYQVRNRVLRMLENAYRDIGRKLGGVYPPGPIQVILYEDYQFEKATQLAEHVGAVYDGKIRCPVSDSTGTFLPEEELERRLTHEYVHVVVRFIAGENVPWWLNEGLAEALSTPITPGQAQMINMAFHEGRTFPLHALETSQLEKLSPDQLRIAYLQGRVTVEYLLQTGGQRRMSDYLTSLATGEPPEQALNATFRRTYDLLQREVAETFL
jgi:tetratricopeptide (TPR) repeat protein